MGTYVRVKVAAETYAVPVSHVLAIVGPGDLTAVPGARPEVLGVRKLRGQIVPVIDLARVLGLAAAAPPGRLLLAEADGVKAGLTIDEVTGIGELPGATEATESDFMLGAMISEGELLGVIDVPGILDSLQRAGP